MQHKTIKNWNVKTSNDFHKTVPVEIFNWPDLFRFMKAYIIYFLKDNKKAFDEGLSGVYSIDGSMTASLDVESLQIDIHYSNHVTASNWNKLNKKDTSYGRDYNFKVAVSCRVECEEDPDRSYRTSLFTFALMRQYNCCGMAVLTNFNRYCRGIKGLGYLGVVTAMILAYSQKYRAVMLTNKDHKTGVKLLEKLGFKTSLEWVNLRTRTKLIQMTADLNEGMPLFKGFAEIVKGRDTIIERGLEKIPVVEAELDPEVKKAIIEYKTKIAKSIKPPWKARKNETIFT
jgi:hypothetical protein